MNKYAIAIHGGAGTILRSTMTTEKETAYKKGLEEAINAGEAILKNGGTSLDAVEAAIRMMENNPLFNAGKGAVFTNEGKHEMDASLMNGKDLTAGAVAGVSNIKHPISLARAVMDKSELVFLAGQGAMEFAKKNGIETAPDEYFYTALRYEQWQEALKSDTVILDHTHLTRPHPSVPLQRRGKPKGEGNKFGTVGAVALDIHGNLSAGTSTGGLTNKKHGRVGDTPIIGAGTYANNLTCAVSCTGYGEYFIRSVVAYDVSCLMEYKGLSLKQACEVVVMNKLVKMGGEGGLIALDAYGNISLTFNSEGMYRASKKQDNSLYIAIYKE
ncbi:MAG: isoaspartyl peptidase/L-asparaginase family protein [Bacteroidia bacterium]